MCTARQKIWNKIHQVFLESFAQAILIIAIGSANFSILREKIFWLRFLLILECPKLLSGLGIDHWRRKTIPLWNSPGKNSYLGHHCKSGIYNIGHSRAGIKFLSFFYRHGREAGRTNPYEPLKLIKHLANTTCVSPYPAGLTGCCPLNFLYMIKLKFWARTPNGCCIL